MDLSPTSGEHVPRRDVADGAVQADVAVMLDASLDQTPGILQRQGRSRPDALSFERSVPTFDLGLLRPAPNEIQNLVARIVRDPDSG
jgi:hypothetical protein